MLRNEPHFATKTEPIPIYASVCDADWDQLSAEDQKRFTLLQGFCDLATATLGSLCLNYPLDLQAVERCIAEGARVQHRALASFHPIDMFIAHGNVPAVKACMQTTHPIDFMIDASGRSLCIAVCTVVIAEDVAGLILEAIVKRIAENRPGDKVDWEQRDWFGHNFFSYAAEYDLLHVVWPIVKPLPYFREKTEPIRINRRVTSEDWDQLSEEDQKRFVPEKGFVSKKFRVRGDRVAFVGRKRIVKRSQEVQWTKVREIGRGSFGVVYLGQLLNGGLVAVKMPNYHDSDETPEDMNQILVDEMEIMRHLRHKIS
eukprot:gene7721-biopygen4835